MLGHATGESACSLAGPHPEPVGGAVPVSVLRPPERGACPDMVLGVGAPPSLRGTIPEVVVAPPQISWAVFPCLTLQPLGDGPVLPFPAGVAPPGLLAALRAFFPVEEAPPGDLPGEGEGPEPQADDLDQGLELDADEDDRYLLS